MKSKNIIFESKRVRSTFGLNSFNPLLLEDISRYKNHGTITGATWVRLPSGLWVLSFDGNDYISCTIADPGDVYSIIAWVKPTNLDAARTIFSGVNYTPDFSILSTTGNLRIATQVGNQYVISSGVVSTTEHTCCGATVNDKEIAVYINGSPDGSGTVANSPDWTNPHYLGRWATAYMVGNIGLFLMTASALSADYHKEFYSKTRHLFNV